MVTGYRVELAKGGQAGCNGKLAAHRRAPDNS